MQNIEQKISQYLKERKYRKRGRIAAAVMSIAVVISVFAGLIMPAVSMTPKRLAGEAKTDVDKEGISIPYTKPPEGAHLFKPDVVKVNATQIEAGPDSDGGIKVKFELNYELPENTITNGNTYIYYNLNTDRADSGDANAPKIDVPKGGLPSEGVLGSVMYAGKAVGEYRIEENGLIVIHFTDEEFIAKNKDAKIPGCYVQFNADVVRGDNDNRDSVDIPLGNDANSTVTIKGFEYGNAGIEKSAVYNKDGTITWSVKVKNPDGKNLKDFKVTDEMFDENTVINCDKGTYDAANKQFVFNDGVADKEITLEYTTKVDSDLLFDGTNVKNKATLVKPDDSKVSDSKQVYVESGFNIEKSGSADYGKDGADDKITWTVKVKNDSGADMEGYYIEDSAITADTAITGVDKKYYEISDGKITFKKGLTDKEIKFTYVTGANKSDSSAYENKATLRPPKDPHKGKEGYAKVEKNQFSITKSGTPKQGESLINWTVTLTDYVRDDNTSLEDFVVTDPLLIKRLNEGGSLTMNGADYTLVKDENGKITGVKIGKVTNSPDWQGYVKVNIKYSTPAKDADYAQKNENGSWTTKNTANMAKDGFNYSTGEVDATYHNISKVEKSAKNEPKFSDDRQGIVQKWEAEYTGEEGDFVNADFYDEMRSDAGTDHYITSEQLDSAKILVRQKGSDSFLPYTGSGTIKLTQVDAVDGKAKKFKITIDGGEKNINGIRVSYYTTVDLSKINVGEKVTFYNKASDGTNEKEVSKEYTKAEDHKLVKSAAGDDTSAKTTVDFKDLETITVDGEECYLLRYKVELNENGEYNNKDVVLTDKLPDGFKLYTVVNKTSNWADKPNLAIWKDGDSGVDEIQNFEKFQYWDYYQIDENDPTKITFKIFGSGRNYKSVFAYAAYIPKADLEAKVAEGKSVDFKNVIADSDGEKSSQEYTIDRKPNINPSGKAVLTKGANPQVAGGSITYELDVNPDGLTLAPNSSTITLTDLFNFDKTQYTQVKYDQKVENGQLVYDENNQPVYVKPGHAGSVVNGDGSKYMNVSLQSIKAEKVNGDGTTTPVDFTYNFENKAKDVKKLNCTVTEVTSKDEVINNKPGYDPWLDNAFSNYSKVYRVDGLKAGGKLKLTFTGDPSKATKFNFITNCNGCVWSPQHTDITANADGTYTFETDIRDDFVNGSPAFVYFEGYSESNYIPKTVTAEAYEISDAADAKLTMQVPDGEHLKITYTYVSRSDEVFSIGASNKVSASTRYGGESDSSKVIYKAHDDSQAGVINSEPIEINKLDVGDTAVRLKAGFILAKYDTTANKWVYATEFTVPTTEDNFYTVADDKWGDKSAAAKISTFTNSALYFKPEKATVYALIEVDAPAGYDSTLLVTKYFTYEEAPKNLPSTKVDGGTLRSDDVIYLNSGSALNIKNRKNISISASKQWADGNSADRPESVRFTLYRSTQKTDDGTIPADAELVEGSEKTLNEANGWTAEWTDLVNGNAFEQPYYYYVHEEPIDGYTAHYTNNGVNDDGASVTVLNSKGLTITKEWLTNTGLAANAPVDSVDVELVRSTTKPDSSGKLPDGAASETLGTYTLTAANSWKLSVTGDKIAEKDADGNIWYYYVTEKTNVENYAPVYSVNGVGSSDVIILTNKNTQKPGEVILPETGGIGTRVFYAAGGAMMIGAAVYYIVNKRRKNA